MRQGKKNVTKNLKTVKKMSGKKENVKKIEEGTKED